MRRCIPAGACALALLALSAVANGPAQASASAAGVFGSDSLWATVDVCSTSSSADVVGLRGSMAGTGNGQEQMYMRFRLQYRDSSGVWHYLGESADSGFIDVGSSRYRTRQAGTNFHLATSTATGTVLRGVVIFDWRVGSLIYHHRQLQTTAGHPTSAGATPAGFSAARCTIS